MAAEKLSTLKLKGELGVNPVLVFTGDIVQSGGGADDQEYEEFSNLCLKPITDALGIQNDRVVIAPGNHEIDTSAIKAVDFLKESEPPSPEDIKRDLRSKLAGYFHFVEKTGVKSVSRKSPRITSFEIDGVTFTVLNGLIGIYSSKEGGHADFGSAFFTETELAGLLADTSANAVICTHHPLRWFTEKSQLGLQAAFTKNGVRLLTGHEHQEGFVEIGADKSSYIGIQGKASGQKTMSVGFNILKVAPASLATARRLVSYDVGDNELIVEPVASSRVLPDKAESFMKDQTSAFFDDEKFASFKAKILLDNLELFSQHIPLGVSNFIAPQFAYYDGLQTSSKSILPNELGRHSQISVVSGEGLAGKSTLAIWHCLQMNSDAEGDTVGVFVDARSVKAASIDAAVNMRLKAAGARQDAIELIRGCGKVTVYIDNFDVHDEEKTSQILEFTSTCPDKVIVSPAGDIRYSPAMQPAFLPSQVTYYEILEVTRSKALEMAKTALGTATHSTPNQIVAKSFKSISNLGTNRSMYFIGHLLRAFADNQNAAEPLDRYLLQKNIIDLELSRAHYEVWRTEIFDEAIYNQFLGQLSHYLWKNDQDVLSENEFSHLLEQYREDMGKLDSQFPAAVILEVLLKSHILRRIDDGFTFLVIGHEDYFLAKHMTHDDVFKSFVLTEAGMLALPNVVQLYVAQNSSDRSTIEKVFKLIDRLAGELEQHVLNEIGPAARDAILSAKPRVEALESDKLEERLTWLRDGEEGDFVLNESTNPYQRSLSIRRNMNPDEIAVVLLQIGCSIVGVSRTLKIEERKKLFKRLTPLILVSIYAAPLLADHLARGRTITYKGVEIKADYVGSLKKESDRFYIILRNMLHNLSGIVGTWAGSSTLYLAMRDLIESEKDPLLRYPMLAQQIEASLQQSTEHISGLEATLEPAILRDSTINRYVEALSLQRLEDPNSQNAVVRGLSEEMVRLKPQGTRLKGEKDVPRDRLVSDQAEVLKKHINTQALLGRTVK